MRKKRKRRRCYENNKEKMERVSHALISLPPSFSGVQMIFKSQLVCLEKNKVCW